MELQKFKELCKKLANKLEYEFVDNLSTQHNFFVIKREEYRICLAEHFGSPGKLTISGEYPRNCKNECYAPQSNIQINVSLNKDIDLIIQDIKRRFLPQYIVNVEIIQKSIKSTNEYYSKKDKILKELSEYIKIEPAKHKEYTIHKYKDNRSIKFVVSRETGFDVTITDINLDQAKEIYDIIKCILMEE